jgi:hypothetical protein
VSFGSKPRKDGKNRVVQPIDTTKLEVRQESFLEGYGNDVAHQAEE